MTPSSFILSAFEGADESPLSEGGKWAGPSDQGDAQLAIVSSALRGASVNWAESYWVSSFGSDQEVACSVSHNGTAGSKVALRVRVANPNSGTMSGYALLISLASGVWTWQIQRIDNYVFTSVGTSFTQALANGDRVLLRANGNQIEAWFSPASTQNWSLLRAETESTYTTAGVVAIGMFSATSGNVILDTVVGGTLGTNPLFEAGIIESLRIDTSNPMTWSHNKGTAGPRGVLVGFIHGSSSTDHVTAVSYGSKSLTRVKRNVDTATEPGAAEWWFAGSGIPTGTQTVSATLASGTTDDILGVSVTIDADSGLYVVDTDGIDENATDPTVTLNYGSRYAMAFGAVYSGLTAHTSITAKTGSFKISSQELSGNFTGVFIRQLNASTTDYACGVTAATDDVAFAAVAVAPVVPVAIGQASETETAQPFTVKKTLAIGQATETDLAQAVTRASGHTVAIGQVPETDTAQPATHGKTKLIGQISETDTAQAVTRVKSQTIGQVSEPDLAQAVSHFKVKSIGQVSESDLAQPATHRKTKAIGQTSETDTAQALTSRKALATGQAVETDSAQAVTKLKVKAIGQTSETDSAQAVSVRKTFTMGQASETDLAQPMSFSGSKVVSIGQASETDLAQPVVWAPKIRIINQVSEPDLAQAVTHTKRKAIAQASETDLGQPLTAAKFKSLGIAIDTDLAQALQRSKARAIGLVDETDLAQTVLWAPKRRIIGQVIEIDEALSVLIGLPVIVGHISLVNVHGSVPTLRAVMGSTPFMGSVDGSMPTVGSVEGIL